MALSSDLYGANTEAVRGNSNAMFASVPISKTWDRAQRLGSSAAELASYFEEPAQMCAGTVGKNGYLSLDFDRRGERTVMVNVERRAPYMVQAGLYWDLGLPEMVCVYLISTSGGVLQGDRYSLDVVVNANASAHLTTQGATKIQCMDCNYAVQAQTIRLEENAYLEFIPEPVIPYKNSRYLTETHIHMAASATLIYSEILLPGRRYHKEGEYFAFDVFSSCVRAYNHDDQELFCEKYILDPKRQNIRQTGVMESMDVFGNVLFLTPKVNADYVLAHTPAGFDKAAKLAYGASRLPNGAGLVFKVLGMEVGAVKSKIREFLALARQSVKGAELPLPFLWR